MKARTLTLTVFWFFIIMIFVTLFFFIQGCANVTAKVPVQLPDKSIVIVEFNYTRWWNQSINGFSIVTPLGYEIHLDKQSASNKASFNLGPYKITVGGDQ